jgi:YD repeat-containing protein
MTSITDPLNHTTQTTIDPVTGNPTVITDALNNQTTMTYNTQGQLTSSTTNPLGPTQIQYLPNGDVGAIIDPLGNRKTFLVDSIGRVIATSDPLGNIHSYQFDGLGRLIKITDPLQATLQYSYDSGVLLNITDAKNGVTRYDYDNKSRQNKHTDPLLAFETFLYDANDNLIQVQDRKNQIRTITYDLDPA